MTLCADELVRVPKIARFWNVLCFVKTISTIDICLNFLNYFLILLDM